MTVKDKLETVAVAASTCRACPLWAKATQTVFGEGPATARVMFIGEQPGDVEDREGRPFVGPAGQILDRALAEAGFARAAIYITNAVKHFKFIPRGKRRIHKNPGVTEIRACNQWLEQELALVQPELIVALGGTAARAVFGKETLVGENRGRILASRDSRVVVTIHPSALLYIEDEREREREYAAFVDDLRFALKNAG
jgi:DNA polymerase